MQRLLLLLALWATTSLAQTLTKAPTLVKSVEPEFPAEAMDAGAGASVVHKVSNLSLFRPERRSRFRTDQELADFVGRAGVGGLARIPVARGRSSTPRRGAIRLGSP